MLLQNSKWYKTVHYETVRGTKRYVVQNSTLQNGTLQNGMATKRNGYKTVTVTKWYLVQNSSRYYGLG
jgi:hypothetical protein